MTIDAFLTFLKGKIAAAEGVNHAVISPPILDEKKMTHLSFPAVLVWEAGHRQMRKQTPHIRKLNVEYLTIVRGPQDNYGEILYSQLRTVENKIEQEVAVLTGADGADIGEFWTEAITPIASELRPGVWYVARKSKMIVNNVEWEIG